MHYFTPKRCSTSNKIMYHDKAQAQHAADQSLIERGAELWVRSEERRVGKEC